MDDRRLNRLKRLPLKRYVELRGNRPVSSLWLSQFVQLVGLLVYVTGDVVAKPCSYCGERSGIFEKCVIAAGPDEQSKRILGGTTVECATHQHNRHISLCDVLPGPVSSSRR